VKCTRLVWFDAPGFDALGFDALGFDDLGLINFF
jgi:hypothetical protein